MLPMVAASKQPQAVAVLHPSSCRMKEHDMLLVAHVALYTSPLHLIYAVWLLCRSMLRQVAQASCPSK